MKRAILTTAFLFALSISRALHAESEAERRIKPYSEDPRYWQYKGEPVLLLGGTKDDNAFQLPDLKAHLDELRAAGGNYIRNTMSDRSDMGFEVYPFKKLPNGKYDLEQWNDAYWKRLENALRWTHERDIIIQIELWDRFDYSDRGESLYWDLHPYNPKNNINYTVEESGLETSYKLHPGKNAQPFFFTIPALQNNTVVLKYQQAQIDKLLSHTLPYGNVLYCMDNETSAAFEWGIYWSNYVKKKADEAGVGVQTTEMYDSCRLEPVMNNPDVYSFIEGSKVMGPRRRDWAPKGEEQWHKIVSVHKAIEADPRPVNAVKIICNPDDEVPVHSVQKFWRNVLGGFAAIRFHRPPVGLALDPAAKNCIRSMRLLESRMRMWALEPRLDLLSDRATDEAYLRARPGGEYALYFTNGGAVGLDLRNAPGHFKLEWIDIGAGKWASTASFAGGRIVEIRAPGEGSWAAAITRTQNRD